MTHYGPLLSATTLVKDEVKNLQGENLGHIKDLMIDTENGRIEYAVLSFGGFLGLGDKYFAVPWQAMRLDRDRECMVLDVEKDVLKNAPGFEKNDWPDFADASFRDSVNRHYGLRDRRAA